MLPVSTGATLPFSPPISDMLPWVLLASLTVSAPTLSTDQVEDCAVAALMMKDQTQWLDWAALALERHRVAWPNIDEDHIQHASLNRLMEKRWALEAEGFSMDNPQHFRAYFNQNCPPH